MPLFRFLLSPLIVLLLCTSAWALVCPPAKDLKQRDGWWSAPGGWLQRRDYPAPTPKARVSEFTGASFFGRLRGPGKLMCQYLVEGQPGVEYTLIYHPSKGGPMDFDWDCPPRSDKITCTCTGLRRSDCEVRD